MLASKFSFYETVWQILKNKNAKSEAALRKYLNTHVCCSEDELF